MLGPPTPRALAIPRLDCARVDTAAKLSSALRSAGGILFQARQHDRLEVGRNRYAAGRWRSRLRVQMLAADLDDRFAREDIDPREQVIRDRAERIKVSPCIDRVRLEDRLR